jgi:hypothetical protein
VSARVARPIAALFALLAFACRLGEQLWLQPLVWRAGSAAQASLLYVLFNVASAAAPIGGFLLATRRARRGVWELDRDGSRFVAPAAVHRIGSLAVLAGWAAGGLIPLARFPFDDRDLHTRVAESGLGPVNGIVLALASLVVIVTLVLWARPSLVLDQTGVTLRLAGSTTIDWNELAPGGPLQPSTRHPAVITLYRVAPSPGQNFFVSFNLPAATLHVDPALLAYTVRRYVDEPHRRAAIGTDAELASLQAEFATAAGDLGRV